MARSALLEVAASIIVDTVIALLLFGAPSCAHVPHSPCLVLTSGDR